MSKAPNQVGTNTTTGTSSSLPPQYVMDAQRALLQEGAFLNAPFLQNQPNYALAGWNPDQEMAFDLARLNAQQAFTMGPQQVGNYGPMGATPASMQAAQAVGGANLPAAERAQAERAQAALSQAAQLQGSDIRNFMNPYQQDVVGTTVQQLDEANNRQLAAIRARQAAESAYGGNRATLQSSEQNRNFGNTLASTVAGLEQSGWNNAANLGMANTQLRQQTGLANQQAQQQVNLANQAAGNQANIFNATSGNQFAQLQAQLQQQLALANAGFQQQANQVNAGYQQQGGQFNAGQSLAASQLQNTLNQTNWQQQMQALQQLLGTGNQQQEFANRAINVPYTALGNLAQIVPNQYGTTGTSQNNQPIYGPSTAQTITSLLPAGIGALGLLSDRTAKKDIDKLGKDPRTDLDMYRYRYKGESDSAPKRTGPMAQQVEQKYPGSTHKVGGKMRIKSPARSILGI